MTPLGFLLAAFLSGIAYAAGHPPSLQAAFGLLGIAACLWAEAAWL